jgi:hypothetical protein
VTSVERRATSNVARCVEGEKAEKAETTKKPEKPEEARQRRKTRAEEMSASDCDLAWTAVLFDLRFRLTYDLY